MAAHFDNMMRAQLQDRRGKLVTAISATSDNTHLTGLLGEVDAALSRMDDGTFGLCAACHEAIEADRLGADPLTRLCLDHLTPPAQPLLAACDRAYFVILWSLLPIRSVAQS
jgi:RNA polymerase-binding transcription factor DksA